jgi:hypothetical protein
VDLQTLLHPHYEATAGCIREHPLVLVAQDTTSLNYDAHPASHGLGPINTRADGAQGLKRHDTLALTPAGLPLGLVDIQVWARDPRETGKAKQRKGRTIEEKESHRRLHSFRRTAEVQRLCSDTRLISIADREADIYELFQEAARTPAGPDLLIRANRTTQRRVDDAEAHTALWDYLPAQPQAGTGELAIPSRGGRRSRVAHMEIRYAPIQLRPPRRLRGEALSLWAIHAIEPDPPPDGEAVEWLPLTTVPTRRLEDAFEHLARHAARRNIEVFHRMLNSGCRIEDRRLDKAESLQACLALDLGVAWRVTHPRSCSGARPRRSPAAASSKRPNGGRSPAITTARPPRRHAALVGRSHAHGRQARRFPRAQGRWPPRRHRPLARPRPVGLHHRYVHNLSPCPARRSVMAVCGVGNS